MNNTKPSLQQTELANLHSDSRQRDRTYVWHTWTPLSADRSQLTFLRGEGYRVWDIDGKEYIDAASLNLTCGYGHPALIKAASEQMGMLPGSDLSISSHEPVGLLAERLAGYLPNGFSKTLFVNSGSEGIEAAMFMAASYWDILGKPRYRVVTFSRGYHGSTLISRVLGGCEARVSNPFKEPFSVTHVEIPVSPRELRRSESLKPLLKSFEDAITYNQNDPPIAVVVEPFLNVGGGIVLPTGFLSGLRRLCDENRTLLIIDEVFTGYGRSGKMYAFQHENIVPDILVSSKGLASGYMPIAAVTVNDGIYDIFEKESIIGGLRYGHTTSGHAVSCAVSLATLDILESENILQNAKILGELLLEKFVERACHDNIEDVRGFGLLLVFDMSSAEEASKLKASAQDKGLLMRQCGTAVMVVPPLTIDIDGINMIAERLNMALEGIL